MEAIGDDLIPRSRFVFKNGLFTDKLLGHEKCIEDHHFNQCIDIMLPEVEVFPDDIVSELSEHLHYLVEELPISRLIEHEFVEAFVKKGNVYILSQDTRIDTEDCVALLPTGELILNVTSPTYIELGLQGTVSRYHRKYKDKYVVRIPLISSQFKEGSKYYNNIKWSLDKWQKSFTFLVAWQPNDPTVCSSSIASYMTAQWGVPCQECALRASRHLYRDLTIPRVISTHTEESDDACDFMDLYEWIGAVTSQLDCNGGPMFYDDDDDCPHPQGRVRRCLTTTLSGLFSTDSISVILNIVRNLVKNNKQDIPWVALSVHGFQHAPVSWGLREHGCYDGGDNSYTMVLYPDDRLWLYKELGSHDVIN